MILKLIQVFFHSPNQSQPPSNIAMAQPAFLEDFFPTSQLGGLTTVLFFHFITIVIMEMFSQGGHLIGNVDYIQMLIIHNSYTHTHTHTHKCTVKAMTAQKTHPL
jgi:hypothetical protein